MGLLACQASKDSTYQNIQNYYFPIEALQEGKVYEYQPIGTAELPPVYWYYHTVEQEGELFFTGMQYDISLIPQQFIREEIVKNGVLLADIRLYETDSLGKQHPIAVNIQSGSVFPFEVKDSMGVFLYKINWTMAESPKTTLTIIKNRRFMGFTNCDFNGKTYPCVEFMLQEAIDNEVENEGHLELEFLGKELYAEGIGLVFYEKKELAGSFRQQYRLAKIYSIEELAKKLGHQN